MPGSGVPTFVQGLSTSYDPASVINASQEIMPIGETVLAGNAVVMCIQFNADPGALTVSDDGGVNTWAALLAVTGVGNEFFAVYLVPNASAFRTVTVAMTNHQDFIQAFIYEFNNISQASGTGALDVAVTTGTSLGPNPSLAFTSTLTDGDLLLGFAASQVIDSSVTQFTPNSGWTTISENIRNGLFAAFKVQATHGAVSFGFNTSSSDTFDMVTVALKAANAGTDPTKLPRILRKEISIYRGTADTTWDAQFTPNGDAVAMHTLHVAAGVTITGVSGTVNTWAKRDEQDGGSGGHASSLSTDNPVKGSKEKITVTFSGANDLPCKNMVVYDLLGCNFDVAAGTTGQQPGPTGGDVTGATITPTVANGIATSLLGIDAHCTKGLTGASFRYDAPNNPESNGSCGNGFSDNGCGHVEYSTTAAITWVWNFQNNTDGVNFWANSTMAFKPLVSPVTQPVGAFVNPVLLW